MTPDAPPISDRTLARTQFLLRASQVEFLDRFCARIRRDSGCRLSKRAIIETLVETIPTLQIPLRKVTSETHLKEFLREGSRSHGPEEAGADEEPNPSGAVSLSGCPDDTQT